MEVFVLILMLAVLVQFCTDRLKTLVPAAIQARYEFAPLLAMIVGLAVAIGGKVDILNVVLLEYGLAPSPPIVGWILTGLIISGGSTFTHELIAKLRESRSDPLLEFFDGLDGEAEDEDKIGTEA